MSEANEEGICVAELIRHVYSVWAKATNGGQFTGPGFDPKLLRQAEHNARTTLGKFMDTVIADIERMVAACALAEDPRGRAMHLEDVAGIARQVAGYGESIGYDLLGEFADSLVTFLRESTASDNVKLEVVRAHVDSMRLVFANQLAGDGGTKGERLKFALGLSVKRLL